MVNYACDEMRRERSFSSFICGASRAPMVTGMNSFAGLPVSRLSVTQIRSPQHYGRESGTVTFLTTVSPAT